MDFKKTKQKLQWQRQTVNTNQNFVYECTWKCNGSDWRIKLDPHAINREYDNTILKIIVLPFVIVFAILLMILNFLELNLITNILIMILLITSAIVQTIEMHMESNIDKNISDRLLIRLEMTKIFDLFAIL